MVQQIQAEEGGELLELWKLDDHPANASTDCVKLYFLNNSIYTKDSGGTVKQVQTTALSPGEEFAIVSRGHVHGAMVEAAGGSVTVQINTGLDQLTQIVDASGTSFLTIASALTVNISGTGSGGLDTGSLASGTWYAVLIIWDSTGAIPPAGLLSLNYTESSPPTLPSGYDKFRRVGWVRTRNSDLLLRGVEYMDHGRDKEAVYQYEDVTNLRALSGGTGTGAWVSLDLTEWLPPTARKPILIAHFDALVGRTFDVRKHQGAAAHSAVLQFTGDADGEKTFTIVALTTDDLRRIQWSHGGGSDYLTLDVAGYYDHL